MAWVGSFVFVAAVLMFELLRQARYAVRLLLKILEALERLEAQGLTPHPSQDHLNV